MRRHPPSSPTPRNADPTALISDSDSRSGRRLHRDSSSEHPTGITGYVTAIGLSTWRRGLKIQRSEASSGAAGWKKGLGMGKEGTPGRRRRARTTGSKSIGYQSTPRASTIQPSNISQPSSPSASFASLPDPDDTQSSSLHNAPSIASPDISPIPKHEMPPNDVFGIMSFIDPSRSNNALISNLANTTSLETTGTMEELTIPVNFPSSEIYSKSLRARGEDLTVVETARGVLAGEEDVSHLDFIVPLNLASSDLADHDLQEEDEIEENDDDDKASDTTIKSRSGGIESRSGGRLGPHRHERSQRGDNSHHNISVDHGVADTVTHEDFTITLNDDTVPSSRRLTAVLSSGKGSSSQLTASRGACRTKERVSTPYRRFSQIVLSTPDEEDTSFNLDDFGAATNQLDRKGGQKLAAHKDNAISPSGIPPIADMPEGQDGAGLDSMTRKIMALSDTVPLPASHESLPSPRAVSGSDRLSAGHVITLGQSDMEEMVQEVEPRLSHFRTAHPVHGWARPSPEPSPVIPPLVYGVDSPVPFVPSSQLGTPLRLPAVSPLSSKLSSISRSASGDSLVY